MIVAKRLVEAVEPTLWKRVSDSTEAASVPISRHDGMKPPSSLREGEHTSVATDAAAEGGARGGKTSTSGCATSSGASKRPILIREVREGERLLEGCLRHN